MRSMLLFGAAGQVGTAIRRQAISWNVDAPASVMIDMRDAAAVNQYVRDTGPNLIINAAAYTKVDDAEQDPATAFAINAEGPAALAVAARTIGARLIHISTDYVFDGTGELPYPVDAATNPLNVYGASKRAGEQAVMDTDPTASIIRTAWVHAGHGVNFVATAVRVLTAGRAMQVVDDQIGTPTRADNLASAILLLAERDTHPGLLHYTDLGVASWYDVACCVLDALRDCGRVDSEVTVSPVDSTAFPRPARRPRISILDTHASRRAVGWHQSHWRDGVLASTRELLNA